MAVGLHLTVNLPLGRPAPIETALLREHVHIESAADAVRHEMAIVPFGAEDLFAWRTPISDGSCAPLRRRSGRAKYSNNSVLDGLVVGHFADHLQVGIGVADVFESAEFETDDVR